MEVPLTLSTGMVAQSSGDTAPPAPTVSDRSTTSVQDFSTEIVFRIVDFVDSPDLHNLNLTNKTFHLAIQQQRWTHARLVGRPQHMSNMIRCLLKMAQDPNNLIGLKKIKTVTIVVPPEPATQVPRREMDWAFADELKYSSLGAPGLALQFVQLFNLLSNKKQCPQLNHITFDPSGLGPEQLDEFNELQSTMLHPINVESLRIKGKDERDATYDLMEKCVVTRLQTLHVFHTLFWRGNKQALRYNHWPNLRKLHFTAPSGIDDLGEDTYIEAPSLEWLSIDGDDSRYGDRGTPWAGVYFIEDRAGYLAEKFPKLKRLAITWRNVTLSEGDTLSEWLDPVSEEDAYVEPKIGFLNVARFYFDENPSLELMTFRFSFPELVEVERVDGQNLVLGRRDWVKEPREDGWPTICP